MAGCGDEILQVDDGGCDFTPHGMGKATIIQENPCPLYDGLVAVLNNTIGLGGVGSGHLMYSAMLSEICVPESVAEFQPLISSDVAEFSTCLSFCHHMVYLKGCKGGLAMFVHQEGGVGVDIHPIHHLHHVGFPPI